MEDLFTQNTKKYAPLADRVRPQSLDEFVGQQHIVREGGIIYQAIKKGTLGSCIFFGPPGTGKTTLANIIAKNCNILYISCYIIPSCCNSGTFSAPHPIQDI